MSLVAPSEGLDEALTSQHGLKRLVKGSQKRSRTPEIPANAADTTDFGRLALPIRINVKLEPLIPFEM